MIISQSVPGKPTEAEPSPNHQIIKSPDHQITKSPNHSPPLSFLSQDRLQDLASRVPRKQLASYHQVLRNLEVGYQSAAELDKIASFQLLPRPGNDDRPHLFPHHRIGHAEHRHLKNRRMGRQSVFHL